MSEQRIVFYTEPYKAIVGIKGILFTIRYYKDVPYWGA